MPKGRQMPQRHQRAPLTALKLPTVTESVKQAAAPRLARDVPAAPAGGRPLE
jgi:hypothetical protein